MFIFIVAKANHTTLKNAGLENSSNLDLINYYILYKKKITSYKPLAFIKFVRFNRHH